MKLKPAHRSLSAYTRSFWWLLVTMLSFAVVLIFYVHSEHQVNLATTLRSESSVLSEELRQSSDDLTNMARSYVATGDIKYQRYYQEILDIRDGRQPRPTSSRINYWGIASDKIEQEISRSSIPFQSGIKISLLDLMRQSGFTDEEFSKLAEAKNDSDLLTTTEWKAMHLYAISKENSTGRETARLMLYDDAYQHAKASIMGAIDDVHHLMDVRTADVLLR